MYIDQNVITDLFDAPKIGARAARPPSHSYAGFCQGTLITTKNGPRLIETLQVGDQVLTRDNGFQRLRWRTSLHAASQVETPVVCVAAGTIGNLGALYLSRGTAVLMNTNGGLNEHLVPIRHLINDTSIRATAPRSAIALVFDRHEIIHANGSYCESLRATKRTLAMMPDDQRVDLLAHRPLLEVTDVAYRKAARPAMPIDLGRGLLRGNKVA